jgi:ABC-type lipoprotein release transport system permease subunit
VALGAALVALTHLVAWLLGQADRRRAEVAGLRSVGIRPGSVRRAYLVEAAALASVVLLAAAVAAVTTTVPLLKPMTLVGGWADAPAVRLGIRPVTLTLVILGAALVTVALCAVAFTRFGRTARPSALRSADR